MEGVDAGSALVREVLGRLACAEPAMAALLEERAPCSYSSWEGLLLVGLSREAAGHVWLTCWFARIDLLSCFAFCNHVLYTIPH